MKSSGVTKAAKTPLYELQDLVKSYKVSQYPAHHHRKVVRSGAKTSQAFMTINGNTHSMKSIDSLGTAPLLHQKGGLTNDSRNR